MTHKSITFTLANITDVGGHEYWDELASNAENENLKSAPPVSGALFKMVKSWLDTLATEDAFINPLTKNYLGLNRGDESVINVFFISRQQYEELYPDTPDALGLFIIDNSDAGPFSHEGPLAKSFRVLWVVDQGELDDFIAEETQIDLDASMDVRLSDYLEAYINTLFHEIEHARLFMENANFNHPADIECLHDAGDIGNDVFDCTTGYGIRDLRRESVLKDEYYYITDDDMGEEIHAREAHDIMEKYVEASGIKHMLNVIYKQHTVRDIMDAFSVKPHKTPSSSMDLA